MAGIRLQPEDSDVSQQARAVALSAVDLVSDDDRSIAADSWSIKSEYGSTPNDDQRHADAAEALSNANLRAPSDYSSDKDEPDAEAVSSMLGFQSYWDAAYTDELTNFREHGHAGEVWHRKLEMSVTENPKKTGAPPIVKLNKALKLAEVWVKNMSRSADDETPSVDTEGRRQRLGLGAKVSRQTKVGPSDDPVERKLHAKLDAEKRKAANIAKESTAVASDDDEDNENESRTNAFAKRKAPSPLTRPISGNKRRK